MPRSNGTAGVTQFTDVGMDSIGMSGASSCVVLIHCKIAACLVLRDLSCVSADIFVPTLQGVAGLAPQLAYLTRISQARQYFYNSLGLGFNYWAILRLSANLTTGATASLESSGRNSIQLNSIQGLDSGPRLIS